ncbi:hypothetical protein CHF27_003735 [Romboutsia maritimum]|uniref:Uncharacterized protein n=1 Tax=Romboutsia maritimum TaxID=2020948 RepID=A0A371IUN6_9FIRM|nr:hypothetical protein [Romboutsia maritimum]RDY24200.1 hypothetical protein CHF27_003735 [Romboutsia maritimum]
MSQYILLTSDCELPEIDLTNKQNITVEEAKIKGISSPDWCTWDELDPNCEILHFENEDDINNLCIYENYDFIDELRLYTENKYIYMIDCLTDKKRAEQLFDYICSINLLNEICIY